MVGAISDATGRSVDRVLAKPSRTAIDADALMRCLMIDDRGETDIRRGNQAGMTTVSILAGVTARWALEAADIRPDYVIESLADIHEVLDE